MKNAVAICLLAATACAVRTQDPASTPPSKPADPAAGELLARLAAGGVRVDVAAQTVSIDVVRNEPADPIEYLLIHARGKAHEALFVTEVKPSLLNAAFYALGCENGTNARAKPIEPPPSEEEIARGADLVEIIPPQGMQLWITARWKDGEAQRELPIEALLLDLTTAAPVEQNVWIFLGGRSAPLYRNEPPVFIADFEGNLVSVCYLAPENHLLTMRHERARDDQNWWMTDACPPPGTAVELRFHRRMPLAPPAADDRGADKR